MTAMTEQRKAESNNSLFERDCERARLPKNSLVSPALAKIIEAQNQTRALHNAERERERKRISNNIEQAAPNRTRPALDWRNKDGWSFE
jgi:hypothetical protein